MNHFYMSGKMANKNTPRRGRAGRGGGTTEKEWIQDECKRHGRTGVLAQRV